MSDPIKIESRGDLQAFLNDQPKGVAVTIALRSALRAMPLIADPRVNSDGFRLLTLVTFRATLISQLWHSAADAASGASAAVDTAVDTAVDAVALTARSSPGSGSASAAAACYAAGYAASTATDGYYASAAADFAADAVSYTSGVPSSHASDFWNQTRYDAKFLIELKDGDIRATPVWKDQEAPGWWLTAEEVFSKRLNTLSENWGLVYQWYSNALRNATIDPFPIKALNDIANESPEFWGDGDDNPRTPDDVIADIAQRLGWPLEPTVSEDSSTEPSFVPKDPIKPDRDGPVPLVPRDHDYFHSAAQKRTEQLEQEIANEGASGEQALRLLRLTLPDLQSALGANSADSFMTALAGETDTLKGLIKTQDEIAMVPEKDRDFEDPLWPKHIKGLAEDLHQKLHHLLENDKRVSALLDQPEDGVPTEADVDFVNKAREAIRGFAESTDLFAPETIELLDRYLERAENAIRAGAKATGRPISFLRGVLGNLANAIARGTKYVWEHGGSYTAKALGGAVIAGAYIASVSAATASLEALSAALGTSRLDAIIAILKAIGGGL